MSIISIATSLYNIATKVDWNKAWQQLDEMNLTYYEKKQVIEQLRTLAKQRNDAIAEAKALEKQAELAANSGDANKSKKIMFISYGIAAIAVFVVVFLILKRK